MVKLGKIQKIQRGNPKFSLQNLYINRPSKEADTYQQENYFT